MQRPSIGFLFLGGPHQVLHIAPVALELSKSGQGDVRLLAAGEAERAALVEFWGRLGLDWPDITLLPQPSWARALSNAIPSPAFGKLLKVFAARALLSSFDAVVAAERTCTILKRLPGEKPYLIHIPHGAGDRAKGFEPRISLFDHVIAAGEKDRDRLVAEGICRAADISVSGYIKLAAIKKMQVPREATELLASPKPIVLYNPHFATGLSSWRRFSGPLIDAFAEQEHFYLIVAPHARLFEAASLEERLSVESRAIPGRIHIDLGSARSNDMTYTLAADVYVGDVSSQVYEFLQAPKPCVFLNSSTRNWKTDSSFGFWHLGEVISDPADVLSAIARSSGLHARFRIRQIRAREQALGPVEPDPIATAASLVESLALRRQRSSTTKSWNRLSPVNGRLMPSIRGAVTAVAMLATFAAGWLTRSANDLNSPIVATEEPMGQELIDEAVASDRASLLARGLFKARLPLRTEIASVEQRTAVRLPLLPSRWRVEEIAIYPSDEGSSVLLGINVGSGGRVSLVIMHGELAGRALPKTTLWKDQPVAIWHNQGSTYAMTSALPFAVIDKLAREVSSYQVHSRSGTEPLMDKIDGD